MQIQLHKIRGCKYSVDKGHSDHIPNTMCYHFSAKKLAYLYTHKQH
jgi:hypothetical protein